MLIEEALCLLKKNGDKRRDVFIFLIFFFLFFGMAQAYTEVPGGNLDDTTMGAGNRLCHRKPRRQQRCYADDSTRYGCQVRSDHWIDRIRYFVCRRSDDR